MTNSFPRTQHSMTQIPNEDLSDLGFSYEAYCQFKHEGFSKQWLPTKRTHTRTHTHTCSASLLSTAQTQEVRLLSWRPNRRHIQK